ncbi:MAG TPA: sigma-70 family RNA polymerase sigma factor [Sunxiuqinia sp.]|nr:sigma-70 family RNA polymerase sigma factor [Sunxiuqinia sp.]
MISRLKECDKSALEYLYDHYSSALYGTILSIVHIEELAQEVLHDTFLKIWRNFHTYEPGKGRLFTWMINVARNMAIDKLRSKEIKNEKKTDQVSNNVHTIDRVTFDTTSVDGIGIKEVVKKLNKDYQLIVELMYFRGYTQSEISQEYNIPLGTVKTRTRAALKELRKILQ